MKTAFSSWKSACALCAATFALCLLISPSWAGVRPVEISGYSHDRFQTMPQDIFRDLGGFVVSFDSEDDDDGDGTEDSWAIPHWVAHEIKRYDPPGSDTCIKTGTRPSKWITEAGLFNRRVAPSDASYGTTRGWRNGHPNWFDRGHLAMKFLLERIKQDDADGNPHSPAAWNSHITLNAVPQRHEFNAGIWKDLEDLTGAWAQESGSVWVITGPVVLDLAPTGFIGDEGEVPVAIPDAMFKIVARGGTDVEPPEVLAFLYPQIGPGYDAKKPYPHSSYLTTVDRIEELTSLNFFTVYDAQIQATFENVPTTKLWPRPSDNNFLKACRGG
jgi:endonuclease G